MTLLRSARSFSFPAAPRASWALLVALGLSACGDKPAGGDRAAAPGAAASAVRPALTVTVTSLKETPLAERLSANGSIAAWQETIVGAETNGLRLAQVLVNVGDVVVRNQVLATFEPATVQAELAQVRASVAEAQANLAEATANAARARELEATGALSAQQINQYVTAERTAQARVEAQRAAAEAGTLRLAQAKVLAPDAGVISARSATVGAVLPAGAELFRLIRQGRLEWRAEVPSSELSRMKPGLPVTLTAPGGESIAGKVRMVGPTVDPQTRNGLVYVDLAPSPQAKAGMFARGEFRFGQRAARSLPASAVLLRDGFNYVMKVGADSKVTVAKVAIGQRAGDQVEILDGLSPADRVVATGGSFLGDGDLVQVVEARGAGAAASAPAAASSPAPR